MRIPDPVLVMAILTATACGSDRAPTRCLLRGNNPATQDVFEYNYCMSARVLAARDTPELTPSQEDIDRYYGYLMRLAEYEHTISVPQVYRGVYGYGAAIVTTTNPTIIAALRDLPAHTPMPRTGEAVFDHVIEELVDPTIGGSIQPTQTHFQFTLLAVPFNEDRLHDRLLPSSSYLPDPEPLPQQGDMWWRWLDAEGTGHDGATAEIRSLIGWGDCISGCQFFHEMLSIVPPEGGGPIEVYDLGGDPF
jgi:hypothetical protein